MNKTSQKASLFIDALTRVLNNLISRSIPNTFCLYHSSCFHSLFKYVMNTNVWMTSQNCLLKLYTIKFSKLAPYVIQKCFVVTKYSLNQLYSNIITYTLLIYFNLSVIKIEQPWDGICIIINYDEFHSNFVFISYTPAYHFYWANTRFSVRPTLMSFTKN